MLVKKKHTAFYWEERCGDDGGLDTGKQAELLGTNGPATRCMYCVGRQDSSFVDCNGQQDRVRKGRIDESLQGGREVGPGLAEGLEAGALRPSRSRGETEVTQV